MASRRDVIEAARLLRELLRLVDEGVLEAGSGQGRAMVRRIEGAVAALEASTR